MMTRETLPKDGWCCVNPGTEISEEIYWDMLNMLPPLSLRNSPYCGFQTSEPYSHEEDSKGRWRSKHMTFVMVGDKYYYAGVQFAGDCEWRLGA